MGLDKGESYLSGPLSYSSLMLSVGDISPSWNCVPLTTTDISHAHFNEKDLFSFFASYLNCTPRSFRKVTHIVQTWPFHCFYFWWLINWYLWTHIWGFTFDIHLKEMDQKSDSEFEHYVHLGTCGLPNCLFKVQLKAFPRGLSPNK